MAQSIIENTNIDSPLERSSTIKPKGFKSIREVATPIMLTPLIDAFSMLLVYLLLSYGNSGEFMLVSKDMVLPTIDLAEHLERQIIVKYENGVYYVEDLEVTKDTLFPTLLKMRQDFKDKYPEIDSQNKIIIQADKGEKFLDLNFIIHASAQAGFEEIKFAVLSRS